MNYKRKSRRRFFLLLRSRTPPICRWIPLWNSNGTDSHFCHYAYVTSCLGEKKKYHCRGDSWRRRLFTKQLKKWVKAVFLLGCYGCVFHGTGNSAQLCKNIGNFGGGVEPPPQTPPSSVRHWFLVPFTFNYETRNIWFYPPPPFDRA